MGYESPAAILYDADGHAISIVSDSGVYRLSGVSKILNASGSQISPATQETLAAIKDTDGIKKIVDALPAGTNELGKIRSLIYDATNGPAAVKPASTPPVAADQAQVVVISPNQASVPVSLAPPLQAATGISFGRVTVGGGAGTPYAVRATAYTEQTVNFTGSIKSSSANDTAAGTGARTVKITYFTQLGAGPYTETVTLNGTTAVNLVNSDHCYIEKMEVLTGGSLGWNAGTITLYTGAGGTGTAVGSIGYGIVYSSAGDNQTLWAHHYVPAGKTISIYNLSGGTTGNQTGVVVLRGKYPLVSGSVESQVVPALVISQMASTVTRVTANAVTLSGFLRLVSYVLSNGTNTTFFASFDYAEV